MSSATNQAGITKPRNITSSRNLRIQPMHVRNSNELAIIHTRAPENKDEPIVTPEERRRRKSIFLRWGRRIRLSSIEAFRRWRSRSSESSKRRRSRVETGVEKAREVAGGGEASRWCPRHRQPRGCGRWCDEERRGRRWRPRAPAEWRRTTKLRSSWGLGFYGGLSTQNRHCALRVGTYNQRESFQHDFVHFPMTFRCSRHVQMETRKFYRKDILTHTPSVPNYLSVLIGTQILRNLWRICENAQLGSNPSLNKLSNELFYTQNGVVNKKIWWFDHVVV
jgi:hypothetical protein